VRTRATSAFPSPSKSPATARTPDVAAHAPKSASGWFWTAKPAPSESATGTLAHASAARTGAADAALGAGAGCAPDRGAHAASAATTTDAAARRAARARAGRAPGRGRAATWDAGGMIGDRRRRDGHGREFVAGRVGADAGARGAVTRAPTDAKCASCRRGHRVGAAAPAARGPWCPPPTGCRRRAVPSSGGGPTYPPDAPPHTRRGGPPAWRSSPRAWPARRASSTISPALTRRKRCAATPAPLPSACTGARRSRPARRRGGVMTRRRPAGILPAPTPVYAVARADLHRLATTHPLGAHGRAPRPPGSSRIDHDHDLRSHRPPGAGSPWHCSARSRVGLCVLLVPSIAARRSGFAAAWRAYRSDAPAAYPHQVERALLGALGTLASALRECSSSCSRPRSGWRAARGGARPPRPFRARGRRGRVRPRAWQVRSLISISLLATVGWVVRSTIAAGGPPYADRVGRVVAQARAWPRAAGASGRVGRHARGHGAGRPWSPGHVARPGAPHHTCALTAAPRVLLGFQLRRGARRRRAPGRRAAGPFPAPVSGDLPFRQLGRRRQNYTCGPHARSRAYCWPARPTASSSSRRPGGRWTSPSRPPAPWPAAGGSWRSTPAPTARHRRARLLPPRSRAAPQKRR
jgi:hypothetical protein